ncbi:facilitated glucose transporter [Gordonia sp. ABSL1-1]|uniref:facilitated glucose transporter n=1 Tax=Gordonia sp. ABSL1-1 TaxID=3053923 RepID=UPI00336542CF
MRVVDRVMLALLVVDGLVVGVLSLFFAYTRFGGVAWPVAGLVGGLVNCVLLWLAAGFTATGWRYAPLAGWMVGVFLGAVPGPGGDVVLAGDASETVPTMLLLAFGAGLPAVLILSGRLPAPKGKAATAPGKPGSARQATPATTTSPAQKTSTAKKTSPAQKKSPAKKTKSGRKRAGR